MEKRESADQQTGSKEPCHDPGGFPDERETILHPALQLIRTKPELFAAQGYVAASYRYRNGKKYGPYYRLGYRIGGRQHSIYLSRAGGLVEQVRRELEAIQMPLAERRMFRTLERRVRSSLRFHKRRVSLLLRPYGLRLKGSEVRGWRYSPLRYVISRRRLACPKMISPVKRYFLRQQRVMQCIDARAKQRLAAGNHRIRLE